MSASRTVDLASSSSRRLRALDGLRGVAAFVVLVHHASLLFPAFSATYGDGLELPRTGSFVWWMSYSPLKLLTAGGEAVIVFFVLSGLVLTLPVLKSPKFDWLAYYPQRVVRLGLPVFASVALAAVWILLVPQNPFQAVGTWLTNYSTTHPELAQFVSAINMFGYGGAPYHVNNPLWSLSWELAFSLALPVFLVLAIGLKRWWIATIVAIVVLTAVGGWFNSEPLEYLPSFLVGALIAVKFDDLKEAANRVNRGRARNLVWSIFLAIGAMLLISSWFVAPLFAVGSRITQLLNALTPLGAGMIVVTCIGWEFLEWALSTRPFRWAGKISFSLYLVHVPVLIFTVYALRGIDLRLAVVVGVALAIVVGCVFYWLVESKCHVLARRVGRRASMAYQEYFTERQREHV